MTQKKNCGEDDPQYKCNKPPRNLYQDLCLKFHDLYSKWKSLQPKHARIHELATPKYRRMKYRPEAYYTQPDRRNRVEIITEAQKLSTRAEQLAFSPVRRLIATRDGVGHRISAVIYERFNKYIRRGMYSMYARLGNVRPPVIINPVKQWTKEDWEKHSASLQKLAAPKKVPEPPPVRRKSKPMSELEGRLEALATPKRKPEKYKLKPDVNPSALKYEATERVMELSKPKPSREIPPKKPRTFRGKKYEVSERTKELAKHREKKTAVSDTKENPFQVSSNALKAKATERVKTLATPKEYVKLEFKDPGKVSPNALKAKLSKRIIELSQPKQVAVAVG